MLSIYWRSPMKMGRWVCCPQNSPRIFWFILPFFLQIAIHDTDKVPFSEEAGHQLPGYQCHNNAVCDIAWMPGEMKLISASSDSKTCLWDVSQSEFVHIRTFSGHSRSVKTVAFRQEDSSVFATGGRDGAILIWDTRASPSVDHIPRADNCIFSGHAEYCESRQKKSHFVANACKSSITGLGFQDENTLISCGAGDGIVKVWDLRRNYTAFKREPLPKYSLPYRGTSTFKVRSFNINSLIQFIEKNPGARFKKNV